MHPRLRWQGLLLLLTLAGVWPLALGRRPSVAAAAPAPNLIQRENAKPGTAEWKLTNPGYGSRAIEGYASLTSVNRGGRIKLFVNTAAPTFTIDIFRMGYYGGLGGRRMMNTVTLPGRVQITPTPDPVTGLVECNWLNPFVLDIPNNADPTVWMSGIYVAKLTESVAHKQQYIAFAVRDDGRFSDLIMAQTVNTAEAYNPWGGKSLYGTIANRSDTAHKAVKVSFNRPYYYDPGQGAGLALEYEFGMSKWLEREGYDVSYATNVDVDEDPNLLLTHKAFLSVGHDEYWSWKMRDNVEHARDVGVSLGFFSGNTSYWQVRYENSEIDNAPARTIVGYKTAWAQDPITPDYLKTNNFRYAPVNRSEDAMIGVMYITQARPALTIEDASHWAFTGTGLKNGDRLVNADGTPFLGYEIDAVGPRSPANLRRLAHSPATANNANFSDMTIYRAASGATVFATGSIGWSGSVPQVQQITRNVLARLITGAFTDEPPVRPSLPAPFTAHNIGPVGRAGFVSLAGAASFTLNGAGQNGFHGQDALYYASQPLNGDGEIVARITAVQQFWDNRAGVMIRESLAPEARSVSVVARPSGSRGVLLEGVELKTKPIAGGKPSVLAARDQPFPEWVKLTRAGNTFTARVSPDGVQWTVVGTTTVAMPPQVLIGTSVAGARSGVWTTASFDHVSVAAGNLPPPKPSTVVIRASDITTTVGKWTRVTDQTAADAIALYNANLGAQKIAPAAVSPANYFQKTFTAQAHVAYHLWIRLKALDNGYGNDSIHVQFSDAVDASDRPIYRIASSGAGNSAQVVLQESDNGIVRGWGWADQGWNGLGTPIYFATSGTHTLRIQQREDGVSVDQIVLSPDTFLTVAPGAQHDDTTIVPR
jgi:hypothetical protein